MRTPQRPTHPLRILLTVPQPRSGTPRGVRALPCCRTLSRLCSLPLQGCQASLTCRDKMPPATATLATLTCALSCSACCHARLAERHVASACVQTAPHMLHCVLARIRSAGVCKVLRVQSAHAMWLSLIPHCCVVDSESVDGLLYPVLVLGATQQLLWCRCSSVTTVPLGQKWTVARLRTQKP